MDGADAMLLLLLLIPEYVLEHLQLIIIRILPVLMHLVMMEEEEILQISEAFSLMSE